MRLLKSIFNIVLFVFAYGLLVSDVVHSEKCGPIKPMKDLDSSKLSGEWYIVETSVEDENSKLDKCRKEVDKVDANGNYETFYELVKNGQPVKNGEHYKGTPIGGVKSHIKFQAVNDPEVVFITTIIDTDYNKYVIWTVCDDSAGDANYIVEITSKLKELPKDTLAIVERKLKDEKIDVKLQKIEQINCSEPGTKLDEPLAEKTE